MLLTITELQSRLSNLQQQIEYLRASNSFHLRHQDSFKLTTVLQRANVLYESSEILLKHIPAFNYYSTTEIEQAYQSLRIQFSQLELEYYELLKELAFSDLCRYQHHLSDAFSLKNENAYLHILSSAEGIIELMTRFNDAFLCFIQLEDATDLDRILARSRIKRSLNGLEDYLNAKPQSEHQSPALLTLHDIKRSKAIFEKTQKEANSAFSFMAEPDKSLFQQSRDAINVELKRFKTNLYDELFYDDKNESVSRQWQTFCYNYSTLSLRELLLQEHTTLNKAINALEESVKQLELKLKSYQGPLTAKVKKSKKALKLSKELLTNLSLSLVMRERVARVIAAATKDLDNEILLQKEAKERRIKELFVQESERFDNAYFILKDRHLECWHQFEVLHCLRQFSRNESVRVKETLEALEVFIRRYRACSFNNRRSLEQAHLYLRRAELKIINLRYLLKERQAFFLGQLGYLSEKSITAFKKALSANKSSFAVFSYNRALIDCFISLLNKLDKAPKGDRTYQQWLFEQKKRLGDCLVDTFQHKVDAVFFYKKIFTVLASLFNKEHLLQLSISQHCFFLRELRVQLIEPFFELSEFLGVTSPNSLRFFATKQERYFHALADDFRLKINQTEGNIISFS